MIELRNGSAVVLVDESCGARMASFVTGGSERLVARKSDPLAWGSYPMAPWAGRVRNGRFGWDGRTIRLPRRLPPHAIHGTVLDQQWSIDASSRTEVRLHTTLGPDWPWTARVEHIVTLESGAVRCRLEISTPEKPFPAQVGWHPWFTDDGHPPSLSFRAQAMYRRDRAGLPTGEMVHPGPHPWDDCFVGVADAPIISWRDGLSLMVSSDCDHWVVYEPEHALCVEPQSGPPDGFTLLPRIVEVDRPLSRTMVWAWE